MKFYRCDVCGKIVKIVKETGVPTVCCGKHMEEIVPGTTDAAAEKHVPAFKVEGGVVSVTVGEVEHPMTEAHYIEWVAIETKKGAQCVKLTPDQAPKATFALVEGDELVAVYAYCNLHSLWAAQA